MEPINWDRRPEAFKAIWKRLEHTGVWSRNCASLLNPGFEMGDLFGWDWDERRVKPVIETKESAGFEAFEGKYFCRLDYGDPGNQGIGFYQPIFPGIRTDDIFGIRCAVRTTYPQPYIDFGLILDDGEIVCGTFQKYPGSWDNTLVATPATTHPGRNAVGIRITRTSEAGKLWIDDIRITTRRLEDEIRKATLDLKAGITEISTYTSRLETAADRLKFYKFAQRNYIDYEASVPGSGGSDQVFYYSQKKGVLEQLSISVEHSGIIIWIDVDGDWYPYYQDPTPDNWHAFGDEDGLVKMHQYTENGRCSLAIKRPVQFGIGCSLYFENPTANPVTCRAEARIYTW